MCLEPINIHGKLNQRQIAGMFLMDKGLRTGNDVHILHFIFYRTLHKLLIISFFLIL